ncbi:MAG: HPr family phosphocarrier protein [Nitrospirae bacterium]|nr:HPr family phosphocarrier protein [Nitrospirota bacterium]
MRTTTVKVIHHNGLHLRMAARLVQKNRDFKSRIMFCKDCKFADGCSILQLLLLEATKDSQLRIVAIGEDEERVIQELQGLFTDGAGI